LQVLVAVLGSLLVASWPGDLAGPLVLVAWGLLVLRRVPDSPSLARCVLAAAAVRVPLLLSPVLLSDDVWRYLWEGAVWRAGLSPFAHAPDDPVLLSLRDEVWSRVAHREVSTIYPPLAQGLFVLLQPLGLYGWRAAMGAADLLTVALLHRRRPGAGWTWALLPLPALESAGSAHLEGVGVLLLVLALGSSAVAAWAGAMVKLLPAVLLVRQRPVVWVGALLATAVCLAPMLGPGFTRGFETYRQTWAFNGGLHPLLELAIGGAARPFLQLVGAAVVAGILLRSRDPGRHALWACGAFVLLSPTVHPWYVLWPLAAALWHGVRAWTLLAALVPLSYVALGAYDAGTSRWVEPVWPRLVIYPPFFALLAWEAWVRLTRPGPHPVH